MPGLAMLTVGILEAVMRYVQSLGKCVNSQSLMRCLEWMTALCWIDISKQATNAQTGCPFIANAMTPQTLCARRGARRIFTTVTWMRVVVGRAIHLHHAQECQ